VAAACHGLEVDALRLENARDDGSVECHPRSPLVARRSPLAAATLMMAALLIALVASPASAACRALKIGTVAPEGSSFHQILLSMGQEWEKANGGKDCLRVYAGGKLGGEAEMVRRMRVGALDGGLLTVVGLAQIDPSVKALQSMPMMFRSLDEVEYVGRKLRPRIEKSIAEKGFVVIFWGDAGWVRFFSKDPVITPDDLKKTKLFSWAGDVDQVDLYKAAGFHPVPLETADIVTGLETGMINAVPLPPSVANGLQVVGTTKNMLAINWAPLVGGFVLTQRAWNRLSPESQRTLREIGLRTGQEATRQNREESDEAVAAMRKRGLVVHELDGPTEALWVRAAEDAWPQIRGRIVPADLFDEVKALLADYRKGGDKAR